MGEHLAWPNDFRTQEIHDEIKLEAGWSHSRKTFSVSYTTCLTSRSHHRFPSKPVDSHQIHAGEEEECALLVQLVNSTSQSSKKVVILEKLRLTARQFPANQLGTFALTIHKKDACQACMMDSVQGVVQLRYVFSLCLLHLHLYLISALKDEI